MPSSQCIQRTVDKLPLLPGEDMDVIVCNSGNTTINKFLSYWIVPARTQKCTENYRGDKAYSVKIKEIKRTFLEEVTFKLNKHISSFPVI
jgi:hypothetical protein